jgi:hypothetical protein
VGLFDRARKSLLRLDQDALDQAKGLDARSEQWGRILSVESGQDPEINLQVALHRGGRDPETVSITTTPPPKCHPEVGDDVAIAILGQDGASNLTYRIRWNEPPQYGIPDPSQQQLQEAVVPGLMTDDPAAKPPGLEDIERMRDKGEVSEQAYETMRANILRPGEELERLHNSGQMSDEIYATAVAANLRSQAGVKIGAIPSPDEATANLAHAMDDTVELDLQRRGTLAFAGVVSLPEPVPDDRFSMRMPLDVRGAEGAAGYRVDCTFPAMRPVADLKVGTVLPIKVDPDDRTRVAVIWNRWLADR